MEKQTARAAWETGGTRSHFWKGSSTEVSLEHDGDLSPGGSAAGVQKVPLLAGDDALLHGPAHGLRSQEETALLSAKALSSAEPASAPDAR